MNVKLYGMPDDTLSLACQLIARRSLTPEDAGCQDILKWRLAPLRFGFEEIKLNGVSNLWARRGTAAPLVCFAGHTDVVPTGPLDEWRSDPFVPTVLDGRLHGRGAADMKTSNAAFVTAIEEFVAAHPDHPGSVALLITSDEEGASVDGTARVVERLASRGERIDFCVVGEPTCAEVFGDTIKNGRRGSLSGTLTVKGTQGHIAYPQLARNPIHLAVPPLAFLAATTWDEGNEYFPPTSFQISNIHAGTGATNVIPGSLVVKFNFRFSTVWTPEALKMRVEDVLKKHAVEYELAWEPVSRPYLTPRGKLVEVLSDVIRDVTGVEPTLSTTGGTSDGRFLADVCPEVAEFGPVNQSIHKIDESVGVAEIEPLKEIYRRVLEALLRP